MERFIVIVVAVIVYLIYRTIRHNSGTTAPLQSTTARQDTTPAAHSFPFSGFLPDASLPQVRTIRTKIHGVSKRNADGSDRQRIIRQCCHPGDALCFVREPTNPFDANAIQARRVVCTDGPDKAGVGEQLGYVSRDLAQDLAVSMDDDGWVLMAEILDVTGRQYGESLGVNIEITVYMPAPSLPQPKRTRLHRSAKARNTSTI